MRRKFCSKLKLNGAQQLPYTATVANASGLGVYDGARSRTSTAAASRVRVSVLRQRNLFLAGLGSEP